MAGANLIVKSGQKLFSEGDDADGMFLVRKGELQVFLERDGNEVKLATIGPGGMIGEMAFFDQKPRSASVKATEESEVTKITNDDFGKLMKQIPKWFVSLMSSLSTRLRETNSRLQRIESERQGLKDRYETTIKLLHVLNLIWTKDGIKQGKDFCINRQSALEELSIILKLTQDDIDRFFKVLVKEMVFGNTTDQYNNVMLVMKNRSSLVKLAEFLEWFLKSFKDISCLPEATLELLETGYRCAKESAYDTFSISIEDLVNEGLRQSLDTSKWQEQLGLLKVKNEAWQLVKASDKQLGLKINKKILGDTLGQFRVLSALCEAGLDR